MNDHQVGERFRPERKSNIPRSKSDKGQAHLAQASATVKEHVMLQ